MIEPFRLPEYDGWLDLEEGLWKGSRVRVRFMVPLGTYFDVMELLNSRKVREIRAGMRLWAESALLEWNITDADGIPIPATPEGLERLPMQGALKIAFAWLDKVPEVEGPLESPSPDGGTSGD